MRLDRFAFACLMGVILEAHCAGRLVAQTKSSPLADSASGLVREALESESAGPSQLRQSLLSQALELDPDFAPARWQLGFVRWQGEWRSPEDIASCVSDDKTLSAYRELRDKLVDTAENHRELAQWCHNHRLVDEARTHWLKVLEFERTNAEARKALGLEWIDGRLVTRDQVKQALDESKARKAAIRHFLPMVNKWRSAVEYGNEKQRADAVSAVGDLSDTAAIPAISAALELETKSRVRVDFQLLLIDAVGRMEHADATSLLLRESLMPDTLELRTAAADQLKRRPMFAYVPQLVAAAPATVKSRFEVLSRANGQIVCREQILLVGRRIDYEITRSANYAPILQTVGGVPSQALPPPLQSVAATELDDPLRTDEGRRYQQRSDEIKQRIQFVLERTTGFKDLDDPRLWEKQWNEYNGWSSSQYSLDHPTYSEGTAEYSNSYIPLANSSIATAAPRSHSCFPAGTTVIALSGPTAIETLRVGDRVLTQDVRSGELTYKTVHETTLRPATPLVKLTIGAETLRATPGHPFWVVGHGWRIAKFLKPGDVLHGVNGAVVVDAVEEARPTEVYNLVVSDVHNYFVGQQRLLVHDNSSLEELAVSVPGLVKQTVAP